MHRKSRGLGVGSKRRTVGVRATFAGSKGEGEPYSRGISGLYREQPFGSELGVRSRIPPITEIIERPT